MRYNIVEVKRLVLEPKGLPYEIWAETNAVVNIDTKKDTNVMVATLLFPAVIVAKMEAN